MADQFVSNYYHAQNHTGVNCQFFDKCLHAVNESHYYFGDTDIYRIKATVTSV